MSILRESIQVRVRFDEVDALGIVWHGNYVKYLEDGREAFGRKYGISYMQIYAQGFSVPLVQMKIDFKRPLRYEDIAEIDTEFIPDPAAKIRFRYTIREPGGQVVLTAETTQVFMTKDGELYLLQPEFYKKWLILNNQQ